MAYNKQKVDDENTSIRMPAIDAYDYPENFATLCAQGSVDKALVKRVLDEFLDYFDCDINTGIEFDESVGPYTLHALRSVPPILRKYAADSNLCKLAVKLAHRMTGFFRIDQDTCDALVEALRIRTIISRDQIADEKYKKLMFLKNMPDRLKGCDGVWRNVFEYYYPVDDVAAKIILWCLHAARQLTRSQTVENRQMLLLAGACEVIVLLLETHREHPKIAHECCQACIVLGHAGRERLINAGACNGVVKAIQTHLNIHDNVLNGCRAIYSLSLDINDGKILLAKAGACDLLVRILHSHVDDKNVVRENCLAIHQLSSGSFDIKRIFFTAGFCEALMFVYSKYGQSNEINVRGLIRDFIAENDQIKKRFISLGADSVLPGLISS